MDKHPIRVLFLCTGNSARSILAEATLRAWAGRRFEAFSAGSRPAGAVNPFALAQLADEGMPTAGLRSKSWDEFATTEAAPMDLVVTVCDSAAEECPIWLGKGKRLHHSFADPAQAQGSDDEVMRAFRAVRDDIQREILDLLNTHTQLE